MIRYNSAILTAAILITLSSCKHQDATLQSNTNGKSVTVYVDMDAVLTDFIGTYNKLAHRSFTNPGNSNDQSWTDQSWRDINGFGFAFWAKMAWMPNGETLWNSIKKYRPEILSSCGQVPSLGCDSGKRAWVKTNLGSDVIVYINPQKHLLCDRNRNTILIDDMKKNIDPWAEKGCTGLLYDNVEDTMRKLQALEHY